MQVTDIIRRAAVNSGVIASFNPDEMPGDVEEAGYKLLVDEVLPSLNCDRSIDITVTARKFKAVNNRVVLSPMPVDSAYIVIGHSDLEHAALLLDMSNVLVTLRPDLAFDWPETDTGVPRELGVWSSDHRFVYGKSLTGPFTVDPKINIEFRPVRIDALYDAKTRCEYTHVYRREYESADYAGASMYYTLEHREDDMIILWRTGNDDKLIVLPVPLFVERLDFEANPYSGTLTCPTKFIQFLVDTLAVRLALVYGLSTATAMHTAAMISYNNLSKSTPTPLHPSSPTQSIANILHGRRRYGH